MVLSPLVPLVLLQWEFLPECRRQDSAPQDSRVPLPLVSLAYHKWVALHQGEYGRWFQNSGDVDRQCFLLASRLSEIAALYAAADWSHIVSLSLINYLTRKSTNVNNSLTVGTFGVHSLF